MFRNKRAIYLFLLTLIIGFASPIFIEAQIDPQTPQAPSRLESFFNSPDPFEQTEFLNLHQQLRILGFLTLLTLIPFVVVMMTSFTRISIIFHFLRQALATQQVPSNQLMMGLSLILTGFVMYPVIEEIQDKAITPYMNNEFKSVQEVKMGLKGEDSLLMEKAWKPLKKFMLNHTREKDMLLFLDMGHVKLPQIDPESLLAPGDVHDGTGAAYDLDAIPWYCLVPSFVLTELRIAFMMGFLLFLPFIVIDMVVASVLMSMGMMMLPPVMISTPFKLLLFIAIDGWRLIIQQVVLGFQPIVN